MNNSSIFVGLDVHKDSIVVAVAQRHGRAESLGRFPHDAKVLVRKLSEVGALDTMLCCYEAGPTGYGLQRYLLERGVQCQVVAPSLVPRRPGERVKTDRRDARKLAEFLRAGELTEVVVPDTHTEAMRDLERARGDAKKAHKVCRQQLGAFLLRHGRRYPGVTAWTQKHMTWIGRQKFEHEAHHRVLEDYMSAVQRAGERVAQLERDISELIEGWHLAPQVKALQAFRGISMVTAVVISAELGNLKRFSSAPQLMSYLGLVPAEHSSGSSTRRFGITRTGNGHVRRMLVESAWAYRFRPLVSQVLKKRQDGVAQGVRDIAWQAQKRLHRRHIRMVSRGKSKQTTVVAVARELAGFVWAASRQEQLLAS